MYKLMLVFTLLIAFVGCIKPTVAQAESNAEQPEIPHYFKNIKHEENFIVYGDFEQEIIRKPTQEYESSFGDGYCIARVVSFKVEQYIQGSGPNQIEFTENVFNNCDPLSAEIRLGKAILFLSKSKMRVDYSSGDIIEVIRIDNELRIVEPSGIMKFISFDNFDKLLSTYREPYETSIEKNWESFETLEALRKRGILEFKIERLKWPEMPQPQRNEAYAYDEYFSVKMYKYIKLDTLLAHDFKK